MKYNYSVIVSDNVRNGDLTNVSKRLALEQSAIKGECVVYRYAYGKLMKVVDKRQSQLKAE